jgi:hypothetical protein
LHDGRGGQGGDLAELGAVGGGRGGEQGQPALGHAVAQGDGQQDGGADHNGGQQAL